MPTENTPRGGNAFYVGKYKGKKGKGKGKDQDILTSVVCGPRAEALEAATTRCLFCLLLASLSLLFIFFLIANSFLSCLVVVGCTEKVHVVVGGTGMSTSEKVVEGSVVGSVVVG